ncbi:hypothetical protein HK104_004766 [Borealophlyctis nickersoniae]|nr:hypothetical protein HK104_004766 [Borealophlyctis nickersoniae]
MSNGPFSLSTIVDKNIFQLNRTSALKKLMEAGLSTKQKIEQLGYLHAIIMKANAEGQAMMNELPDMLEGDKFGLKNRALDDNVLEVFIRHNPIVFNWFKKSYPTIAARMEAGLEERKSTQQMPVNPPPSSNDNEIHELRQQLHKMTALLEKKQKRITSNRLLPKKRRVAKPEEPEELEELEELEEPKELEELDDDYFYGSDLEESVEKEGGPSDRVNKRRRSSD